MCSRTSWTGSRRSLSLEMTSAASTVPRSTSSSRWAATLTSEPFSSRLAYETMNTASLTAFPSPSWIITGQSGPTSSGRPCGPRTAIGAVRTLVT